MIHRPMTPRGSVVFQRDAKQLTPTGSMKLAKAAMATPVPDKQQSIVGIDSRLISAGHGHEVHHGHRSSLDSSKFSGFGLGGMKRTGSGSNLRNSCVSLASLQSGHHVDVRSLPELPPALFLAAIFNDVAFFKVSTSGAVFNVFVGKYRYELG